MPRENNISGLSSAAFVISYFTISMILIYRNILYYSIYQKRLCQNIRIEKQKKNVIYINAQIIDLHQITSFRFLKKGLNCISLLFSNSIEGFVLLVIPLDCIGLHYTLCNIIFYFFFKKKKRNLYSIQAMTVFWSLNKLQSP